MPKYMSDIWSSIFIVAFCFLLLGELDTIPIEGAILPKSVLWLLIFCSGLLSVEALLKRDKNPIDFFECMDKIKFSAVFILFLLSVYTCITYSYLSTIFLLNLIVTHILTDKKTLKTLFANFTYAFLMTFFIYFFFTRLMNVYFPENLF